jgi:EAL domain-containing protein (putative c-di-GMP-specific phosphodiesterase class I)
MRLVVAEGVETAEDAQALLDLRVGYGQGWFWGRAVPADLLEDRFPTPAAQTGRDVRRLPRQMGGTRPSPG